VKIVQKKWLSCTIIISYKKMARHSDQRGACKICTVISSHLRHPSLVPTAEKATSCPNHPTSFPLRPTRNTSTIRTLRNLVHTGPDYTATAFPPPHFHTPTKPANQFLNSPSPCVLPAHPSPPHRFLMCRGVRISSPLFRASCLFRPAALDVARRRLLASDELSVLNEIPDFLDFPARGRLLNPACG